MLNPFAGMGVCMFARQTPATLQHLNNQPREREGASEKKRKGEILGAPKPGKIACPY